MRDNQLSIIVPIYNVAGFLSVCLQSIQRQTYKGWTCLCIDDGSIDNATSIVQEFVRQDNRFVLVSQRNGGVASARQRGLDNAQGRWIAWIDPDDWVDEYFLEHLIGDIKNNDLVWSDLVEEIDGKSNILKQECEEIPSVWANTLIKKDGLWGGLVNKVFCLKLIRDKRLSFNQLPVCEDACFLLQYLSVSKKIAYCPYAEYHYRIRMGSLCHSSLETIKRMRQGVAIQYALEALNLSFDIREELARRRQWIKFFWYANTEVPDERFEEMFPEIKDVDMLPIPLLHKILFRLACRRCRPLIRVMLIFGRKLKRLIAIG